MFTGIVEEIGTLRHVAPTASGARLEIACRRVLERLAIDDSVNVAGACLTVVQRDDRGFVVDVVPETLARTTLAGATRGTKLNLERAATPTTALGGHLVQGHVDGTTKLVARKDEGEGARLRFALPSAHARYVVVKGFITLDGVSLTIAALGKTYFEVALIPHTASRTTLGALRPGDAVNLETDVIAKYVQRILVKP
ncbi:MAG: riboflavin synthase [Chloroflexi bacterium]|nr:MAG: riboflavin synthase [Chloroflexota bacterium]